LYTITYGPPDSPPAQRAARAYARAIGDLGDDYQGQAEEGHAAQIVALLRAEEANLRHALDLARAAGLWHAAVGCLQGLRVLYERTGRNSEWARLVAAVTPDFTDPATGGPPPGREEQWNLVTEYRVRLARQARDWPVATALLDAKIAWTRAQAAAALAGSGASLTKRQRNQIRSLAAALGDLGNILLLQRDRGCLPHFQETLGLVQRIGDRAAEAQTAGSIGNAYLLVPGLRDLDQAEYWFQHGLSLRPDSDRHGRALNLRVLGDVALEQARTAGEAGPRLLERFTAALRRYQQSLDLISADDHEARGATEHQLGTAYLRAGDTGQALRHFQQAIKHHEAWGDIYRAGQTRYNTAVLLAREGRISDALLYARAALGNFEQAGPGAATNAAEAEQLIARLEQRNH
jgi:tetratricopeptide (TPR) repeat protein